ncbi:hypothetical protein GCM10025789_06660 [Tessaracoccus lubricantis]|uniref:Glycosyl transferase family 1 domain-containing protein n=2 Tax=Tessaracoccus lubricantis TaxID=545543 RepID=A0ABP9F2Y4_9ACTN
MWFYQKSISQRIRRNLHKADRVIVQATWMKEAVVKHCSLPSSKIAVVRPSATPSDADPYEASPKNRRRFFYPASDLEYKNHAVIHSAVDQLNRAGIENFEVLLTISERDAIREAANTSGCIRYVGRMDLPAVQQQYASAVLIFPSIVETVGLPLLEARQACTFVIASDLAYAREALGDYRNAFYFQPTAADQLAELMAAIMTGELPHYPDSSRVDDVNDSWTELIEIVLGAAS